MTRTELSRYRDMMRSNDVSMWDLGMTMLSEVYKNEEINMVAVLGSKKRRNNFHIPEIKRVYLRDEYVYIIAEENLWTIHHINSTNSVLLQEGKYVKL